MQKLSKVRLRGNNGLPFGRGPLRKKLKKSECKSTSSRNAIQQSLWGACDDLSVPRHTQTPFGFLFVGTALSSCRGEPTILRVLPGRL